MLLRSVWGNTTLRPASAYFVRVGGQCGTASCAACTERVWADARKNRWPGVVVHARQASLNQLRSYHLLDESVQAIHASLAHREGLLKQAGSSHHAIRFQGEETLADVPQITLATLWQRVRAERVDVLHLDLEGYNHEVRGHDVPTA